MRSTTLRVTIDTNIIGEADIDALRERTRGLPVEFKIVSVTKRERGSGVVVLDSFPETGVSDESRGDEAVWAGPIAETLVLDESGLVDEAVLASESGAELLELILKTISNGSFPKPGRRDALTKPQRRQLRDAMILEAHAREGRDVFVTKDKKAFGADADDPRRERLQEICSTLIMTPDEFYGYCKRIT